MLYFIYYWFCFSCDSVVCDMLLEYDIEDELREEELLFEFLSEIL